MWFLSFLPSEFVEWAVHGFTVFCIVGYIASKFAGAGAIILRAVFLLALIVALFFEGNLYGSKEQINRVKELEEKLKLAEEKSGQVNTVIQEKIIEKVKYIKETSNANVQFIERVVTQYDNMCTLSNAAIVLHNSASQNVVAPSTGPVVEGTSDVKASDLLKSVTENYGTYYQVREQVLGWQEWYKEQKKIYESVNK
jgi:hypothetical protein